MRFRITLFIFLFAHLSQCLAQIIVKAGGGYTYQDGYSYDNSKYNFNFSAAAHKKIFCIEFIANFHPNTVFGIKHQQFLMAGLTTYLKNDLSANLQLGAGRTGVQKNTVTNHPTQGYLHYDDGGTFVLKTGIMYRWPYEDLFLGLDGFLWSEQFISSTQWGQGQHYYLIHHLPFTLNLNLVWELKSKSKKAEQLKKEMQKVQN